MHSINLILGILEHNILTLNFFILQLCNFRQIRYTHLNGLNLSIEVLITLLQFLNLLFLFIGKRRCVVVRRSPARSNWLVVLAHSRSRRCVLTRLIPRRRGIPTCTTEGTPLNVLYLLNLLLQFDYQGLLCLELILTEFRSLLFGFRFVQSIELLPFLPQLTDVLPHRLLGSNLFLRVSESTNHGLFFFVRILHELLYGFQAIHDGGLEILEAASFVFGSIFFCCFCFDFLLAAHIFLYGVEFVH
mmetsp:Transcript_7079/g.10583  ORF Transcript_7079/g.10583 Transcript_7079/m.10583 type:complete len:245 (+) Transcript_7079:379-1113(+)